MQLTWEEETLWALNQWCDWAHISDTSRHKDANGNITDEDAYRHEVDKCHTCYFAEGHTVGTVSSCKAALASMNITMTAAMVPYSDLMECGVDYFNQEPFPICINDEIYDDARVTHVEYLQHYAFAGPYSANDLPRLRAIDEMYNAIYDFWSAGGHTWFNSITAYNNSCTTSWVMYFYIPSLDEYADCVENPTPLMLTVLAREAVAEQQLAADSSN